MALLSHFMVIVHRYCPKGSFAAKEALARTEWISFAQLLGTVFNDATCPH